MITPYLLNELTLRLVEMGANLLLRLLGGPDRVPQTNEDFILY